MAEHTPGPWEEGRADMSTIVDGVPSKWVYAGSEYVAVASGLASQDWNTVMANARLIAAAPDMQEAIEKAVSDCVRGYDGSIQTSDEAFEMLRAALRKAKGLD